MLPALFSISTVFKYLVLTQLSGENITEHQDVLLNKYAKVYLVNIFFAYENKLIKMNLIIK